MTATDEERDLMDLERVAGTYRRAAFDEEPPARLNEALRASARQANRPARLAWQTWLAPAAVAATVLMAVSVIVQIGPRDLRAPAPGSHPAASAARDAATAEEITVTAAGAESARARSSSGPETDAPQRTGADPDAPARTLSFGREGAAVPMSPEAVEDDAAQPGQDSACGQAARAAPETWLDCIRALGRAGERISADRETEAFRERYPSYRLPAEFPADRP